MSESKCAGKLVEITTNEGVSVDFCPENGGILFDHGEVALYFELDKDVPQAIRDGARRTGVTWPNPKHPHGTMVEVEFPTLGGLKLDFCDKTGAVWFDKGEVPHFEELTATMEKPTSRLVRVFHQLRKDGYEILGVKKQGR